MYTILLYYRQNVIYSILLSSQLLSILESLVPVRCEDSHFFNKNKTTISINKISLIITISRPPNLYRSHHPHTNGRYPKIIFPISEKQKEITPTKLKTGHCYVILKVAQKKAIYMEGSRWTRDEEIRIHPCSPWRGEGGRRTTPFQKPIIRAPELFSISGTNPRTPFLGRNPHLSSGILDFVYENYPLKWL